MGNRWNIVQGPEDLSDTELGCRVGRHPFPPLRPGKKIPRNVDVHRQPDGWYEVAVPCPECEAVLVQETYKGDVRLRTIVYPEGWSRIPRATGIRKSDIRAEYWARLGDELERVAT